MDVGKHARDLELVDAIDAFPREPFSGSLWRVTRDGRDPLLAARSNSRWCDNTFDVLYTAMERDGAIAEVQNLLSLQPVFPAKLKFFVHRLGVSIGGALRLADFATLARLGVDVARYQERTFTRTREIAEVAYFLGFDGLIAPSARWKCSNIVLFADRIEPDDLRIEASETEPIDWAAWRRATRA